MWRPATSVVLALCAGTLASAQVVPVSGCGQIVPRSVAGVMMNDITCAPTDPFVVDVGDRGTLDLAGYTLDGGEIGVRCVDRCIVTR